MSVFLLGMFIVGIPTSIVLRWFVTQDNWEIVSATSAYWLAWIPNLIYVLTVLKLALSSLAIDASYRHQFVTKQWIVKIVVAWLLIAVLGAVLFWLIWPGNNLPFYIALIGSILFLPLGAIFAAPIAVDANRHRSAAGHLFPAPYVAPTKSP